MPPLTTDSTLDRALAALAGGRHRDPFGVLGPHRADDGGGFVVRTIQPAAEAVDVRVLATGELYPMRRQAADGVFEVALEGDQVPDYRLRIAFRGGHVAEV